MEGRRRHRNRAYSLAEFAVVLLIVGLMFSMIPPVYFHFMDEAKSEESEQGLAEIAGLIDDFYLKNGRYPDSLEEVASPVPLDPWGRPYEYLRIDGGPVSGQGKLRKDKNLVPINSDYDLYSKGPDGESVSPLTANPSKDDIVRGRNGKFFGTATDY
ncbi:MAG TPA: prepilin-type cleavage/methylation domain-containing protein [Gammaproteobacteria bacterium]